MVAAIACSGLALAAEVKSRSALSSGARIDNQTGLTCSNLTCDDMGNQFSFSALSSTNSAALAPISTGSNFTGVLSAATQFEKPTASFTTGVRSTAATVSTDSFTLSNGIIMGQLASSPDSVTASQNPVTLESKYSLAMPPVFAAYATDIMSNVAPSLSIFVLDSFGLPQTKQAVSQQNSTAFEPTVLDLSPVLPASIIELPTPNTATTDSNLSAQNPAGTSGDPIISGSAGTLDTSTAPEPSTTLLIGAGLIAVSVFARVKRQVRS